MNVKNIKYVLLNKNGNVTNKKFKVDGELPELLNKSTRMKMPAPPSKLYSYNLDNYRLDIWGYIDGKAGQENTHDLPPSGDTYLEDFIKSDTDLLFGDSFALKYKEDSLQDIDIEEYAIIYDKLCGGFEDLGDDDSWTSEDEEPTQEDLDFIADDNSELSYDEDWDPENLSTESESDSESQSDPVAD